jgi:hypothetical protein
MGFYSYGLYGFSLVERHSCYCRSTNNGFKGFTIFMDASKSLFGEMSSWVISLRESRNFHNQMGFSFVPNVGLYATYLLKTYFVSISGVHKSITLFASLS